MSWLRQRWETSADPWSIDTRDYSVATLMDLGSVGLVSTIGPLVFIFSKGLERSSAQAFFSYIKGWAHRAQAQKKINS